MSDAQPLCAVVGAGPGNGRAFAERFAAAGYRVALLARHVEQLRDIAQNIPDALLVGCDVSRRDDVRNASQHIQTSHGSPAVLIYNAGSGTFGSVDDIDEEVFEQAWRINAAGLLAWVQAVLPGMREAGGGRIVVVGATAAKRGGADFAAFASAKHAQYGLAQSLARKLAPENIHVSYVVIDGVIDTPRTREMMPDAEDAFFLNSDAIAESVYQLTQQPASARSFEIDLRPFGERW